MPFIVVNGILLSDFISVQCRQLDMLRQTKIRQQIAKFYIGTPSGGDRTSDAQNHAEDDEATDTNIHYAYWTNERTSKVGQRYVSQAWVADPLGTPRLQHMDI